MSKALKRKLNEALSYDQWKEAALAYDKHYGLNRWKENELSRRYDFEAISLRLDELKAARESKDNSRLLFTLNEGIHGNLGGMGSSSLYQKAKFGTKKLIVDYIEEITSALNHLAKPRTKGVSLKEKNDFFHRAHLCFGQSALMFSGSGTFVFFHIGVLKALWEQDLIPNVISGASGGALITAAVGTRKKQQLKEIFTPEFLSFEKELTAIARSLSLGSRSKVRQQDLITIIEKVIPDVTFAEAYQLSGLKINVSIAPYHKHQKSRLLNAITSPNVMVREAVLASCCIPGIFRPVTLAARDVNGERVPYLPNRKWVDGSFSADLPTKQLSRLYDVNHTIVSQTNPFVLPFIHAEKNRNKFISTVSSAGLSTMKTWGLASSKILKDVFKKNRRLNKLLTSYNSILSQTYTGDINILPANRFITPFQALSARSTEEMVAMINEGQRATWPQIERIRIQTQISKVLNDIVDELDDNHSVRRSKAQPKLKKANDLKLVSTKKKKSGASKA